MGYKVPVLEKEDTHFLENLIKEIPAFMYFLLNRNMHSKHVTRTWFTPQQIKTKALTKLVHNNRNRIEHTENTPYTTQVIKTSLIERETTRKLDE